jgi:hypothetical protein
MASRRLQLFVFRGLLLALLLATTARAAATPSPATTRKRKPATPPPATSCASLERNCQFVPSTSMAVSVVGAVMDMTPTGAGTAVCGPRDASANFQAGCIYAAGKVTMVLTCPRAGDYVAQAVCVPLDTDPVDLVPLVAPPTTFTYGEVLICGAAAPAPTQASETPTAAWIVIATCAPSYGGNLPLVAAAAQAGAGASALNEAVARTLAAVRAG